MQHDALRFLAQSDHMREQGDPTSEGTSILWIPRSDLQNGRIAAFFRGANRSSCQACCPEVKKEMPDGHHPLPALC